MRPDAADVAVRLARTGLPADAARSLAIVSAFEGGFDAIQTYDRAKFSWGFIQFAATGGLPRLLQELKSFAPETFAEFFAAGGIDIDDGQMTIRRDGREYRGRRVHDLLHDDPSLWTPFLKASHVSVVQDIQVSNAYRHYYAHPLKAVVRLGGHDITLGTLLAGSELGRTILFDRAVNRGVGHTTVLFRNAILRCAAHTTNDLPAILDRVRIMEAGHVVRLNTIAQQFEAP